MENDQTPRLPSELHDKEPEQRPFADKPRVRAGTLRAVSDLLHEAYKDMDGLGWPHGMTKLASAYETAYIHLSKHHATEVQNVMTWIASRGDTREDDCVSALAKWSRWFRKESQRQ